MRKALLIILLLCLGTTVFAMGERVKELPKTENGTPIYGNVQEQYYYAQQRLQTAQQSPSAEHAKAAAFAFYDYRKMYADDSNVIPSYFFEAKSYFLVGDYAKFSEVYAQFIEKDTAVPHDELRAEGQYLTGRALQLQEKYDAAVSAYEKVEQQYPKVPQWIIEARKEIASCYQSLGDLPKSITVLEDLLQKYPANDYNQAYCNLSIGLTYQKLGERDKALAALKKVVDMPESPATQGPRSAARVAYLSLLNN